MKFETITHLRHFCEVFGQTVTAGQRCRLPKAATPKKLCQNDVLKVVCGGHGIEEPFNPCTAQDGVDLEFDGNSEL
jgi:hypothetical protein